MSELSPNPATTKHDSAVAEQVRAIASMLQGRRLAVLTGAGISVDSGIPAYRGAGGVARTPMTAQMFLGEEESRRRFWLGGHLGWRKFAAIRPNPGHVALAAMERDGLVSGVITQNVDALHLQAGSRRVVELHGNMHRVRCLGCERLWDRTRIAQQIEHDNPWVINDGDRALGPDGDVVPAATDGFIVPVCEACSGMLRPDVVYFGETVPVPQFREAEQIVADADALLVAGTSLVVNSGVRIIERARRRDLPIVIVNPETTRADQWATAILTAGTSEALPELARWLGSP